MKKTEIEIETKPDADMLLYSYCPTSNLEQTSYRKKVMEPLTREPLQNGITQYR